MSMSHATPLLWCAVLTLVLSGCRSSESIPDAEVAALLDRGPREGSSSPSIDDLGSILARGQAMTHEFRLTNDSDRPVHILGAEALKPCCSSIKSQPNVIPARGSASLVVEFRPGFQSGRKGVEFVVRTDDPAWPSRRSGLAATLIGEVEVLPLETMDAALSPDSPARQTYRIIARKVKGEGRGLPSAIRAGPSTSASFRSGGETAERDGIVESTRDFAVDLMPSRSTGEKRDAVLIAWDDGREWTVPIAWKVKSRITATPEALIIKPGEIVRKTLMIRSDDRPFRVASVRGATLAECVTALPTEPGRLCAITVAIDSSSAKDGRAGNLVVETDHPDGIAIPISIIVPPSGAAEGVAP